LLVDYIGIAIGIVLTFVITPVLVRLLGAPMYGFWITAVQILAWLNLLDGGIGINLLKTIGTYKTVDPDRVRSMIGTTFWLYVGIAAVTIAIGMGISPFVAGWTHVAVADAAAATIAFRLAVVSAAITLIVVPTFYVILQAYQRLAFVNVITNGTNIMASLAGLALVSAGMGVAGVSMGQLGATLIGATVAFLASRRLLAFGLSWRNATRAHLREIGAFAGYFTMSKLAFLVSNYSDAILIAVFYGTSPVAVYALTQRLAGTALTFLGKIGGVALPGLAEIFGENDRAALQRVTLRFLSILTRAALLGGAVIIAVNRRFVEAWTGPQTYGGLLLTVLIVWCVMRDAVVRNLAAIVFASGDLKGWGWLSVIEAAVKVILALALLPATGILGPAIAAAIAGTITMTYVPLKLAKMTGMSIPAMLDGAIRRPLLLSIPTILAAAALSWFVPQSWRWFGIVLIGGVTLLVNLLTFDLATLRRLRGVSR
jgi:O-antigen/teichoic acid export membrane protein